MGMASIERQMDSFVRLCGGSKTVGRLVAVNCGVFLLTLIASAGTRLSGHNVNPLEYFLPLPAPPSILALCPWTPLTYMVTQFSLLHMIFNMLWLICFGGLLRSKFSDRALLALYVGSGLAGGIFFELGAALQDYGGTLVGSSASVLGIMAASAIIMPRRKIRLIFLGEVRLIWVAIAMILLTFVGGGGSGPTGAFYAHAGGVLFGAATALIMRQRQTTVATGSIGKRRERTARVPSPAGARKVAQVLEKRLSDSQRLDQLLDKIRISGYTSLSRSEQRELEEIGKRIKNTSCKE